MLKICELPWLLPSLADSSSTSLSSVILPSPVPKLQEIASLLSLFSSFLSTFFLLSIFFSSVFLSLIFLSSILFSFRLTSSMLFFALSSLPSIVIHLLQSVCILREVGT
ncbi:hypothetical protein FOYG_07090 [Fusarium oxysporum NRRL 32931]|uniref:Uncharacterized protein n=1 Tax=Fusarium oxysporum NRRL 32931 TaxID=660029 RepID=W9IH73_FUSOX|nr:hypothetical protein FOYG_07090 [Fusarium oxysporum NRRL 32931]